jgi:NTP pyrophosphatase (non-canonical NTP hydrolase)
METTQGTQPFQWTNEFVDEFAVICSRENGDGSYNEEQRQQLMQEFINTKQYGWQVVRLKGMVSGRFYSLKNGKWHDEQSSTDPGFAHDFHKQDMWDGYHIWSVRRLSDKVVFTVGDNCYPGEIQAVGVSGGICVLYFKQSIVSIESVNAQPSENDLLTTQHDAIVKYNAIVEFAKKVHMHSVAPGDLAYNALGLTGESGEVANVVKKLELNILHPEWVTGDSGLKSTEELEHDLLEELGDQLFYAFRIMLDQGITIWDVIDCQARKLNYQSEKYGRTFLK